VTAALFAVEQAELQVGLALAVVGQVKLLRRRKTILKFPLRANVNYNFALMDILSELRQQRERINNAIQALSGRSFGNGRRRGRPKSGAKLVAGRKPRRKLSAAARKRISQAAKQRWAAAKKLGRRSL